MKTMNKILTAAAALSMLAGCQKNEVKIHADFTTDKDVYELYEDISSPIRLMPRTHT